MEQNCNKKKYEYLTITQHVQKISFDDCDDIESGEDLEKNEDDVMTVYFRVSQMRNLKEMEYLVLKLMGYQFFEMPEILGIKSLNGVYQVGNKMKGSFEKTNKEKVGF